MTAPAKRAGARSKRRRRASAMLTIAYFPLPDGAPFELHLGSKAFGRWERTYGEGRNLRTYFTAAAGAVWMEELAHIALKLEGRFDGSLEKFGEQYEVTHVADAEFAEYGGVGEGDDPEGPTRPDR